MDRDRAERRLAAIAGFREEATRLEDMGLLTLDGETRREIRAYHDDVIDDLANRFDLEGAEMELHWGLKIATIVGALAVLGLVLTGVDLLWGGMATWARLALAVGAPILMLLLTEAMLATGRRRFFVVVSAGLTVLLLAIDLRLLAAILNRPFGMENTVFLGIFGAILGHRYRSPSLAGAGVLAAAAGTAAMLALADGSMAEALPARLDPLAAFGLGAFLAGASLKAIPGDLRAAWRAAGLLLGGGALILLGHEGRSLLPADSAAVAGLYQLGAAIALFAALATGLLAGWRETAYGALALIIVLAFDRLTDWFGDLLPEPVRVLLVLVLMGLFAWLAHLVRGFERARREEVP